MATFASKINGNDIFAKRAELTKSGVDIDAKLSALEQAIAAVGAFEVVSLSGGVPDVVDPSTKIIYLTKESGSSKTDPYTEWIWTGSAWEVIGETSIDLSGYATNQELQYQIDGVNQNIQSAVADLEGEIQTAVADKQDTISDLATIRSGAAAGATAVQPSDLSEVATTGSYDDLSDKPTIPAAQVNSDWNATSGVAQIINKPTIPTITTVELT